MSKAPDTPTFQDVQQILNFLVKGKEDRLDIHDADKDPSEVPCNKFGWETREQLLAAVANPEGDAFRLIDPSMIGNGQGDQTVLVRILTGPFMGYQQMPKDGNIDGEYANREQLDTITRWIDAGAPA